MIQEKERLLIKLIQRQSEVIKDSFKIRLSSTRVNVRYGASICCNPIKIMFIHVFDKKLIPKKMFATYF